MRSCLTLSLVFFLALLRPLALYAQEAALGEISFPNTGAPEAQDDFREGLLLLHSFEYEDAAAAFARAQAIDPDFAMAAWGHALTHNHPIWNQQDRDAARAILAPWGTDARAGLMPVERALLGTLDALYAPDGTKAERDRAYVRALEAAYERFPAHDEVAAQYALALLGANQGVRDVPTYMRAAAVAEEIFARNPKHPGAAHYLIHAYDDPVHAPLGLRAARVYAGVAPGAAHALHMPSHIFVALGMWDAVVASNVDSYAAGEARRARLQLAGLDGRNYHARYWLHYGLLQQGRWAAADSLLREQTADVAEESSSRTRAHLALMRAAHVVDTRDWDGEAARLPVDAEHLSLRVYAADAYARARAALGRGEHPAAREIAAALGERLAQDESTREASRDAAEVMHLQLRGLLALEADPDAGLALLREAAVREAAMPFDFGPPIPVEPAYELLAHALLEQGDAAGAAEAFRAALERTPRRARALEGLAEALSRTDAEAAAAVRATLADVWHRADAAVWAGPPTH